MSLCRALERSFEHIEGDPIWRDVAPEGGQSALVGAERRLVSSHVELLLAELQ